ncbi:hypothetical protein, partial [Luteimicrobium sp. DT211]|uniref:hypothetical protein n=1 Tax=Luteimicrobium sp. DT211 TaxID=3393412 RepID=UPI003CE7DBCB
AADAAVDAVVADAESVLEGALRRALGSLVDAAVGPVDGAERGGATRGLDASAALEVADGVPAATAAQLEPVAVSAALEGFEGAGLDGADPGSADPDSSDPGSADPVAVLTDAALEGLEDVVPGPVLARILAGVSVADVTDDALVEVVAAAERLRSWALAVQARAAG